MPNIIITVNFVLILY